MSVALLQLRNGMLRCNLQYALLSHFKTRWVSGCSVSPEGLSDAAHIPVMCREIVQYLDPLQSQTLLDMTYGTGGHTNALLTSNPQLKCYCLDRDPASANWVEVTRAKFRKPPSEVIHLQGKFSDLPSLCQQHNIKPGSIDLIVMDLGISSLQLDDPVRGFSFRHDSNLDMRMGGTSVDSLTAADVVNNLSASELAQIFKCYGEERFSRRIANAIFDHRHALGPVRDTKQLARIVTSVIPSPPKSAGVHSSSAYVNPLARVFQALRIFVNDELNELCFGLEAACHLLHSSPTTSCVPTVRGGRLAVLSFHSLEDRIVKRSFTETIKESGHLCRSLAEGTVPGAGGFHQRQKLLRQLNTFQPADDLSSSAQIWKWVSCYTQALVQYRRLSWCLDESCGKRKLWCLIHYLNPQEQVIFRHTVIELLATIS